MFAGPRSWVVVCGVLACTPAHPTASEPAPSPAAEPTDALVVDIPSPQPVTDVGAAAPEDAADPSAIVQDLAIVLPTGMIVQESMQCFVGASWAEIADGQDEPPDLFGAVLHLIDARGATETTVPATPQLESATRLRLVTRTRAPAEGATLSDRWLQPRVPDGAAIVAWARAQIRKRMKVVGQITGTFGDGVDRIVVLAPRKLPTMEDDASAWQVSEIAVLVAGDTPRGYLPFTRTFEVEGDDEPPPGIYGMQVAGVIDLDGDGIEEVVWSSHPIIEDLVTQVHVSYFADGEHRVHEISGCTYWGCNMVLPENRCRGPVKRMP